MADYVTAANKALSLLGENDQLRDPDDDSAPARTVRAVWDTVRKEVLRDHPWNFAIRRTRLTADASWSGIGFAYAFPLPSAPAECLRLLEILEPATRSDDYALEGGKILCDDLGPIAIRYVADVEDVSRWDPLFVDAFAAKLAFQICDRITGDLSRQSAMEAVYRRALSKAKGVDAKENPPVPFEDSSWVTARYGW
jgi:hypothetical protein